MCICYFFFSSRRRLTRCLSDWSSDVCSSDLAQVQDQIVQLPGDGEWPEGTADLHQLLGGRGGRRGGAADGNLGEPARAKIGRASCRKEGRSRGSRYKEKKRVKCSKGEEE